ncbi:MAG: TolC family protein [Proteobacteria bacterium]|nr:TolC family protein [Pseudomonadota bacterium]
MKPIVRFVAGVIASNALGSFALAQPSLSSPPAVASGFVTLAVATDAAWQRAVEASETQGQRQRADAERVAASSLWAAPPALLFGWRDDRWQTNAGNREAEIALAWPLWLPGQRDARGAAAESAVELAKLAQQAARLRIAGEVREAAWTLIALQAELAQAEAQARALRDLADDVDRRVRAGDLARADALAARAELMTASAREAEARQRLFEARSHWAVLTGLEALPGVQEPGAEPPPAASADMALHPELRLAAQATELARRRVEVARSSRRDPPEIAVGLRQEVPARGELTQNSIGIGLRLPFGTDDRNQPLQAAALSEFELAMAREQRLRSRLDADTLSARAALRSADQQLADHQARSALLRERAQLIDKSFRAGESPLPELLRALDAAAQADAARLRQQAAVGLARARIQQTLGLLP